MRPTRKGCARATEHSGETAAALVGKACAARARMHPHALVWIDAREARIIDPDVPHAAARVITVHPHGHDHQKHPDDGRRHTHDSHHFAEVAKALEGSRHVLIVGPAQTPKQLATWIGDHAKNLASAVVGVETMNHKTDGELGDYARHYFKAKDRMV